MTPVQTFTMFKYPLVTYVTKNTLTSLLSLSQALKDSAVKHKDSPSMVHQYNLFFILNFLRANLQAVDICAINLSSVFSEIELEDFTRQLKSLVLELMAKDFSASISPTEGSLKGEMEALWIETYKVIADIFKSLIYVVYGDIFEMLSDALESSHEAKEGTQEGIKLKAMI